MSIHLKCPAFENEETIPDRYTADGEDVSPPLEWSGVPEGTQGYVLTCTDPDALGKEPFVHWLIYNIPASVSALPEGLSTDERFAAPIPADQGKNGFGTIGYRGPKPPVWHGIHHYIFRIHALDGELALRPGATKEELMDAMAGKVLATGELVGTYKRRIRKALRAA
jgi:Raf kinase inhibitor-like YbhB/YbcL family protein